MDSSCSPFTFVERVGLVLLAETSAVSACAIIGLLSYIAVSELRPLTPPATGYSTGLLFSKVQRYLHRSRFNQKVEN